MTLCDDSLDKLYGVDEMIDTDDKAVAFLVVGLWLMGLPVYAGIAAGVYGLTLLIILMIFWVIG
jgi:hypothetical protein